MAKSGSAMRVFVTLGLTVGIIVAAAVYFIGHSSKSEAMSEQVKIKVKEKSPDAFDSSDLDLNQETSQKIETVTEMSGLRVLGAPNAPITISEHSSFTCGHCGSFHQTTYKEIKKKYVDTGKVKIIFSDFPLNEPALHASMVARCLPNERYFDFVQLLFETQDKWAYERDYLKYLKQNSALAGLSASDFDSCIKNKDLQQKILEGVEAAQKKHDIRSTPSFVLNDQKMISGNQGIEVFSKEIDTLLKQQKSKTETE